MLFSISSLRQRFIGIFSMFGLTLWYALNQQPGTCSYLRNSERSAMVIVKGEANSTAQKLVAEPLGSLQLQKQRHLLLLKCLQVFCSPSSCQSKMVQGSIGLYPICQHTVCSRYSWGIYRNKMFGQPHKSLSCFHLSLEHQTL